MSRLARYRKALVALLGSGLTAASQVLPDPWAPLAGALLGLLTTYGVVKVANAPGPRPAGRLNLGPSRRMPPS